MTTRVQPQTGWVQVGDTVWCDVCARRIWVFEVHHLVPMAWGGSNSRRLDDHQVIWVAACGDCHGTVHMILDKAHKDGGWPGQWIGDQQFPHLIVETARRGWNAWKQQTPEGAVP